MLNPQVDVCKSIIRLKNGHLTHGKSKNPIFTFNTCPFDSLYFILSAMYADVKQIQDQINQRKEECQLSKMVALMFEGERQLSFKVNSLLRLRNEYLREILSNRAKVFANGMISIDCSGNVNNIIQTALPEDLYSYKRIKQCDQCGETLISHRCFIDIEIEQLQQTSIKNLNKCLIDTLMAEKSSSCHIENCAGKRNISNTIFSNFIMIDLTLYNMIRKITLGETPKTLCILNQNFSLFGAIEYLGEMDDDVGHYVAHVRRSNLQWEQYDDLKAAVRKSNLASEIKVQVIITYTINSIQ